MLYRPMWIAGGCGKLFDLRVETARQDALVPVAINVNNGDDARYPDKAGTFTKGLPHDSFGRVDLNAYNSFKSRIGSPANFTPWTAAYPGITEIQAGSYVVMDNFHGRMVPGFEHSLTIQASVISRQSKQVIVDVGNKSVADPYNVTIVGHDLEVFRSDEEHGIFAAPDGSPLRVRRSRRSGLRRRQEGEGAQDPRSGRYRRLAPGVSGILCAGP